MSFNDKYVKYKELVQKELSSVENIILGVVSPREELRQSLVSFLISPSKRLRPVLSLLYLKALNKEITPQVLKLLAAIEIVHNASLIHDDIIDESDYRRGNETIAHRFGAKLGVITGDYLLSLAMGMISELGSINILSDFSNTLRQMCIGEINQNFDLFKIGTIDEYVEKSKNKTAYLFRTAIVCPLLLLAVPESVIDLASDFALNFGISFQIRDDLINLSESDVSKPHGNDIAEGIYNAPVIYSGGADDLSSGIEKTHSLLNNYLEKALLSLSSLDDNNYRTSLIELTELLKDE